MHEGFTIWFTGLSGAGKSTISEIVYGELRRRGCKVELLDGDVVRTHLSKGLTYSREDRDTNVRRIGWVCHLLSRNGVIAISAAISPYAAIRKEIRGTIGRFVEVFCDAPLQTVVDRDVKGLYKKAMAGEILQFTGVDDPYEPPERPEVHLRTDRSDPVAYAARVLRTAELLGHLKEATLPASVDDEDVRRRLRGLGLSGNP